LFNWQKQILFDMGSHWWVFTHQHGELLRNSCKNNQGNKGLIFYDWNEGNLLDGIVAPCNIILFFGEKSKIKNHE